MRDHGFKTAFLRVHNHDGQRDAVLTQLYTFIGICHCQIVHAVELQNIGDLIAAAAIAESLDHSHHLRFRFEQRLIYFQIIDQCIQVYFQNGLMRFFLQQLGYLFKLK